MIKLTVTGGSKKTDKFLAKMAKGDLYGALDRYGKQGVEALRSATPRDSGMTAESWSYEITRDGEHISIWWRNTNRINGYFNVAIGLQYGHATGTGGYIAGQDYINPALRPIFDKIAEDVWKEVTKA